MSVGVGFFLLVLGTILAFAMRATTPGINVNTLGVILLLIGLVVVLYSLLFGSTLARWGRRRIVGRRRTVVEERPVWVVEERPVEMVEERPSTWVFPSFLNGPRTPPALHRSRPAILTTASSPEALAWPSAAISSASNAEPGPGWVRAAPVEHGYWRSSTVQRNPQVDEGSGGSDAASVPSVRPRPDCS